MPDTGPPWNIPYVEDTDLVRDYPQASEDLADAIAAGLDAAGGLVAVKHVLKTNTFVASSIAGGANVAVDDLSITHTVADAANRLIITAYFGVAGSSSGHGSTGIAVAQDATLIAIGGSDGNRTPVGAGGWTSAVTGVDQIVVSTPSVTFVHTPGAGAKTYTVHAINVRSVTETLYVNRTQADTNSGDYPRAASALVIQEVKV